MKKTDIESAYRELEARLADYRAKRAGIEADANLSAEGKAAALESCYREAGIDEGKAALADMLAQAAQAHKSARGEALRSRLTDEAYQARLSRVDGLIRSGALQNADDMEAVAGMFAGDALALSALRAAATEAGAHSSCFAVADTYDREARNLASLRDGVKGLDAAKAPDMAALTLQGGMDYLARVDEGYCIAEGAGDE